MDGVELRIPLDRSGQLLLRDQRLVLLHPRHMGVAEYRNPVGLEVEGAPRRVGDARLGLQRQAVDQVEIERADAERARGLSAGLRLLVRLHAPDGALHGRFEILHAEADAGDAHGPQRVAPVVGQRGRVELDGDLGVVARRRIGPSAGP